MTRSAPPRDVDVDYRRVFRACLGIAGAIQFVQHGPDRLVAGGLRSLVAVAAAGTLLAVAAVGVAVPDRAGGPERPGLLRYVAVVSVLLRLAALVAGAS